MVLNKMLLVKNKRHQKDSKIEAPPKIQLKKTINQKRNSKKSLAKRIRTKTEIFCLTL